MRELIAKLEAAMGPDRELDFLIGRALNDIPLHWRYSEGNILSTFDLLRNSECRYTSSIDTAVALAERVHGWSWRVGNTPSGRGFAYFGTSLREHEAATPAIALCIAILRASQEGSEPS